MILECSLVCLSPSSTSDTGVVCLSFPSLLHLSPVCPSKLVVPFPSVFLHRFFISGTTFIAVLWILSSFLKTFCISRDHTTLHHHYTTPHHCSIF
ncbi:hypothetical protein E2C01_066170 [Portunus trituberculatus]|uniref:Uncharacterized protein n=1 Tax=Portunus trituberculatus TaxID=210409 RepID=A0A5B7HHI8_PORTR|nr:hypothetical protein [Portunus trituberculatus]